MRVVLSQWTRDHYVERLVHHDDNDAIPFLYSWQLQRSCICFFSYKCYSVETLQTCSFYHILVSPCLDLLSIPAGENTFYFPLILKFASILYLLFTYILMMLFNSNPMNNVTTNILTFAEILHLSYVKINHIVQ